MAILQQSSCKEIVVFNNLIHCLFRRKPKPPERILPPVIGVTCSPKLLQS